MKIVVFCSFLCVLLTYLESKGRIKSGMLYGFVIITFLGMIHYNYGTDYEGYHDSYQNIISCPFNLKAIWNQEYGKGTEPGWFMLNYFFQYCGGFFAMVAVLNVFQNVVYYRIIRKYVPVNWLPLAVLVYVCSGDLYVLNFSLMRQGLAASMFFLALPLLQEKKYLWSIALLYIISLFHNSAQILIVFAFWPLIIQKGGKAIAISYAVILGVLYVSSQILGDIFFSLANSGMLLSGDSVDYYIRNNEITDLSPGMGFFINMIPLILGLMYLYKIKKNKKVADNIEIESLSISIAILSFFIIPFMVILPMIGRFVIYFATYQTIAIPFIYKSINDKKWRTVFLSIYILILLYSYFNFFKNPSYVDGYYDFHTIFEAM